MAATNGKVAANIVPAATKDPRSINPRRPRSITRSLTSQRRLTTRSPIQRSHTRHTRHISPTSQLDHLHIHTHTQHRHQRLCRLHAQRRSRSQTSRIPPSHILPTLLASTTRPRPASITQPRLTSRTHILHTRVIPTQFRSRCTRWKACHGVRRSH